MIQITSLNTMLTIDSQFNFAIYNLFQASILVEISQIKLRKLFTYTKVDHLIKETLRSFFSAKRLLFPRKCVVFFSFLPEECTCKCVRDILLLQRCERTVEKGLSSSRRPKRAEKRQLFRKHTLSLPSSLRRFTRRRERWCIAA